MNLIENLNAYFDALIALAGDCSDFEGVKNLAQLSEVLVAADGGADLLLDAGIIPDWVVGDNDSVRNELPDCTAKLLFSPYKNYTDGELAIALAFALAKSRKKPKTLSDLQKVFPDLSQYQEREGILPEAFADQLTAYFNSTAKSIRTSFLLLFVFGKRIDHSLANLMLALSLARKGNDIYLSDGLSLARIICGELSAEQAFPEQLISALALQDAPSVNPAFSALPLDENVQGFTLKGLEWELDEVSLDYSHVRAVSNRSKDPRDIPNPTISLKKGTVLLVLTPAD